MTLPLAAVLATSLALLGAQEPGAGTTSPPPRVEWQRSLADALAVQRATGLPLLIAVNMDGEVFNDRFASTTYRDPAFVESTRGYVCVVASPDRHTETDYDALGRRVECPRFPGCTCSEHIQIEPELFSRWFDGKRNAPRHVGVDKDGKVLFDRFLDQSMQAAIDAIAKHRGAPPAARDVPQDVAALLQRRDAAARRALEAIYGQADSTGRIAILDKLAAAGNEAPDLLRMALRDDDDRVFDAGAMVLGKTATAAALIDIEDALARTGDGAAIKTLVARLQELGRTDKAAARLASHFEARDDVPAIGRPWSNPWGKPAFDPDDRASIEAELDRCEAALRANGGDEPARLALATAQLALADVLIRDGGKGIELWFDDARGNAGKIRGEALQSEAAAVVAYASYMRSDSEAAGKATAAAQTAIDSSRAPDPYLAARMLEMVLLVAQGPVFADPAAAAGRSQRAEMDRATAAMDLLLARGAAREHALLGGIALLEFAGCRRAAAVRLQRVVHLFPASAKAHERWRTRLLVDLGAEAMRARYAEHCKTAADTATAEWFAGYAALVAAEQHTRDNRRPVAETAYGDAIDRFHRCVERNADYADSANHFAVLALGGRAHLRHARGDGDGAVADLLQAASLRAASLDESDGLSRKPRAIAGRVARELAAAGNTELAGKLAAIVQ